jgi:G3E family GTPase
MSIPLNLVTGFFGSGKTSFVKHYLKTFENKGKIAIIQNEFSAVDIDSRELNAASKYEILSINNGSVFCVCLLGSFIESLAAFVEEVKPDELLMEASGMSDPIGVGQIFQAPLLKGKVFLNHIWCIVDANNFERTTALRFRLEHQLRVADSVVVNKTDLVKTSVEHIINQIKKVNPFTKIQTGNYGQVDLSGMKKAINLFPYNSTQSAGRPEIDSIVIKSNREISPDNLNLFISTIFDSCIRLKGFVKVTNERTFFIQGVFKDLKISEVPKILEPTELVMKVQKIINQFTKTIARNDK